MKNNFIKLTPSTGEKTFHINSMLICGIVERENYCIIHTMGGQVYTVNETIESILKLINDSEKYFIKNLDSEKI